MTAAAVAAETQAVQVAPGIWRTRMPLPFQLDHVNLWLLEDGDGWCLVDAGLATPTVRARWLELFDGLLHDRPVTRLVVTHMHPDHVGLAAWLLERTGAAFLMTRTEWLEARLLSLDTSPELVAAFHRFYRATGLPEETVAALAHRGNTYRAGVPLVPAAFTRIADGDRLAIGGRSWRVITVAGHSPEHACLASDVDNILIVGDQVLPRISPNISVWGQEPFADPLAEFLASFNRFAGLAADTLVLPSHGEPFRRLHQRIEELRAHHQERLETTLRACRTPVTAYEAMRVLFERPLDAYQTMFAIGEALAHLNHLVGQGRLQRTGDELWRFAAA